MIQIWAYGLIGLWIMVSPWLLGFSQLGLAKWSNVLFGLVLVLLSVWKLKERSNSN